jgi:hypothetical protein
MATMSRSQDTAPADTGSRLHLLSLPVDIRWIVYSHLFPSLRQVYLMASKESVNPMMRPGSLGTDVFLVCRQLQVEASDYLFNNYLFNIIGYKKYCMAHYKPVYKLVERHARNGAEIEILDNGDLSSTACVSIYAKEGHVEAVLQVRKRGVQRDLKEVEEEAAQMPEIADDLAKYFLGSSSTPTSLATLLVLGVAILIAMLYSISN